MKIKTIILDDERAARSELKYLLQKHMEIEVVGEADSVLKTIGLIEKYNPDLLFLDIQLVGETGFELLEQVPVNFFVIFVTAYDEYAIRAFDVNAADYLLKPIDPERLKVSIQRLRDNSIKLPKKNPCFAYSDKVYLQLNNKTARFVSISSIISINSIGNYSKIIANDGNSYLILKTIKQWESELPKGHFLRIHRSSIVNIEYINSVEKYDTNKHRVLLENKTVFNVSRGCASKLKEHFS